MDIVTIITTIGTVLTAFGGAELIKWLIKWFANRKANKRKTEAHADQEEVKAESEEFEYLRNRITFKEEQLIRAEQREADKTKEIRRLNSENLELVRKITMLETERSMKLCEVRNCASRVPQSGY